MANNQITPFRLTDQFTMDNFNQRINETNTALQNNDPRRWGIGGVSKELTSSDDLNTIFENGLYRWGSSVPQNAPTEWPTSYPAYCMMRVWCYGVGDAIQEISSLNYDFKYTMKRICRNNVWTIEWDNPPMELGKEYRTTERYLGKPVYVMAVDFGALPNATTKDEENGSATIKNAISAGGTTSAGGTIPYHTDWNNIDVGANKNAIFIKTIEDQSDKTAVTWIWYTKTTD